MDEAQSRIPADSLPRLAAGALYQHPPGRMIGDLEDLKNKIIGGTAGPADLSRLSLF